MKIVLYKEISHDNIDFIYAENGSIYYTNIKFPNLDYNTISKLDDQSIFEKITNLENITSHPQAIEFLRKHKSLDTFRDYKVNIILS